MNKTPNVRPKRNTQEASLQPKRVEKDKKKNNERMRKFTSK